MKKSLWLDGTKDLRVAKGPLEELMALRFGAKAGDVLGTLVAKPFQDLLARPGKRIRGRLVELGYALCRTKEMDTVEEERRKTLSQAIEYLHAGSLAIDDLQDGSTMRRGQPALHVKYGLPLTITIGNTLYFWPLEMIRSLDLPPEQELNLYRIYHRTLIRAHLGQSFDVGIPIDTLPQDRIWDVCMASIELKSGALFSLGLLMGAVLAEATEEQLDVIDRFGHGFGMGLQMFDDLGNLKGKVDPKKRWEDILLRRPTWIWACAARYYGEEPFREFVSAAHQLGHDTHPLETWLEDHDFHQKARTLAHQHFESCFTELEKQKDLQRFCLPTLQNLRQLGTEISHAYE